MASRGGVKIIKCLLMKRSGQKFQQNMKGPKQTFKMKREKPPQVKYVTDLGVLPQPDMHFGQQYQHTIYRKLRKGKDIPTI